MYIPQQPYRDIPSGRAQSFGHMRFAGSGRVVLKTILKNHTKFVLISPAFQCAETFYFVDPSRMRWYDLNRDFSPDVTTVPDLGRTTEVYFLLTHFFGHIAKNRDEIIAMCKTRGWQLIEDFSHAWTTSVLRIPQFDLSKHYGIFSFRKELPIYNGGGWIGPGDFEEKLCRPLPVRHTVRGLLSKSIRFTRDYLGLGKSHFKCRLPSAKGVEQPISACLASSIFCHSQKVVVGSDYVEIRKRRQGNLARLEALYPNFLSSALSFQDEESPLAAIGTTTGDRSEILHKLNDQGVPAFIWPDAWATGGRLEAFPQSSFFYRNLVCLPIHQDVRQRHIDYMGKVFRSL